MSSESVQRLKDDALPELAQAVRRSCGAVLRRWKTALRDALPPARRLSESQLSDDLPKILPMIADALAEAEPQPASELDHDAASHGGVRYDQDFDLGQLLTEYSLLRRIVIEAVREEINRDLQLEETSALNAAIDLVSHRAIIAFAHEQRRELRALAEAQTKYLSFLSHDLRGGLNGVLLMIEVLRRDLAAEERFAGSVQDLDIMRRSILETVGTMDRFLHAERFRKGKVAIKAEDVDLAALVQDVAGQFGYQARDKKLELKAEVSPPMRLTTDRELVALILQNFVANAVKYARSGAVRIVATRGGLPRDCACRISVIDQGPGIAPERLSQLFAPFTRGETHGQPGTGLGLSIARQAADLLGARLRAESTVGKGSAFHLDLPERPPAQGAIQA